jgi:hypothetical protein
MKRMLEKTFGPSLRSQPKEVLFVLDRLKPPLENVFQPEKGGFCFGACMWWLQKVTTILMELFTQNRLVDIGLICQRTTICEEEIPTVLLTQSLQCSRGKRLNMRWGVPRNCLVKRAKGKPVLAFDFPRCLTSCQGLLKGLPSGAYRVSLYNDPLSLGHSLGLIKCGKRFLGFNENNLRLEKEMSADDFFGFLKDAAKNMLNGEIPPGGNVRYECTPVFVREASFSQKQSKNNFANAQERKEAIQKDFLQELNANAHLFERNDLSVERFCC